jgi:hypothetical protein
MFIHILPLLIIIRTLSYFMTIIWLYIWLLLPQLLISNYIILIISYIRLLFLIKYIIFLLMLKLLILILFITSILIMNNFLFNCYIYPPTIWITLFICILIHSNIIINVVIINSPFLLNFLNFLLFNYNCFRIWWWYTFIIII